MRRGELIALVLVMALLGATLTLHRYVLDGVDRWVFSTGLGADTEYAAGPSDDRFSF